MSANDAVKRAEHVLADAKKQAAELTEKGKTVYEQQKSKIVSTLSKSSELPPAEG